MGGQVGDAPEAGESEYGAYDTARNQIEQPGVGVVDIDGITDRVSYRLFAVSVQYS